MNTVGVCCKFESSIFVQCGCCLICVLCIIVEQGSNTLYDYSRCRDASTVCNFFSSLSLSIYIFNRL